MPDVTLNGARLHVRVDGHGEEAVVFLHGLLFSSRMFDEQVNALKGRYRCIRLDFRGQGRSEVTPDGYDMDSLAADVVALIEALDCAPCHLVGFSMGGFVGLRVALARPELLRSLVLMNTAAEAERPAKRLRYRLLNFVARRFGLERVIGAVMPLMFSDAFVSDPAQKERLQRWVDMVLANDRVGVTRAVRGVTTRESVLDRLDAIDRPTLIIAADQDRATPPARARRLNHAIHGSRMLSLPGVGHMSPAEAPEAVNRALAAFFESLADSSTPG